MTAATMPDLQWFYDNGCVLATDDPGRIFPALFTHTREQPCRECNCKQGCPAFPILPVGAGLRMRTESIVERDRRAFHTRVGAAMPSGPVPVRVQETITSIEHSRSNLLKAKLADEAMSLPEFRAACARAGVEPTRRQANKFLREEGAAWEAFVAGIRESVADGRSQ